jgi:hypothetical protein
MSPALTPPEVLVMPPIKLSVESAPAIDPELIITSVGCPEADPLSSHPEKAKLQVISPTK